MKILQNITLCILVTAAALSSKSASAQYDSTWPRQTINAYGFDWKNAKFKTTLIIPADTVKLSQQDSGGVAYKSGSIYIYDGNEWKLSSGSGSSIVMDSAWFFFTGIDTSINAMLFENFYNQKDTVYFVVGGGSGGGDFDTTYIYNAIATKLNIADTTNQWFANASKINDSTYRFYKGSGYFDVIVPVSSGGGTNIYNSNGALTGSRTVDGNGNNIHFDDIGDFNVTAAGGLVLNGATYGVGVVGGLFSLNMPSGSSTDSIVVWDASTLQFKVRTQTSGGGSSPDTIYAKFPIQVDTTGVKDSLVFKLPPQSVPVNLHATDTLEAQFMKVRRQTITTLPDTVRFVTTGSPPSGTVEKYYRWSQLGSTVNLQIWVYYPTNGTSVTSFWVDLPSDCPAPAIPTGWTSATTVLYEGTGGMYINRTRTIAELPSSAAACVMRMNDAGTKPEVGAKGSSISFRAGYINIVYETTDY